MHIGAGNVAPVINQFSMIHEAGYLPIICQALFQYGYGGGAVGQQGAERLRYV